MSNPNNSFQVPKPNDRSILDFFDALRKDFSFPEPSVHLLGSNRSLRINQNEELFESVRKNKSKTIVNANCSKQGITVTFERGIYFFNPSGGNHVKQDSPILDTLRIEGDLNQGITINEISELSRFAQKHFFKDGQIGFAASNDALQVSIASHHEVISKLEQALADVGEKFAEKRLELAVPIHQGLVH